jgi:hypothetical protein
MVAVAPILAVMVALLAILVYYGAEWLGKVVVRFTPDIHIPAIGNLRDLVRVAVDAGIDIVRGVLKPVVQPVVDLIVGIGAWCVKVLYGGLRIGHAATVAIHRLFTVIIPREIDRLQHWAAAQLAALETALGTRIHQLRADLGNDIRGVRAWVTAGLAALETALGTRIHQLRADLGNDLGDLRAWARDLVGSSVAAVAAELDRLRGWTAQQLAGVETDLSHAVTGLEADIAAGVKQAIHAVDVDMVRPLEGVWEGLGDDVHALEGVIASDFPDIGSLLRDLDLSKLIDLLGVSGLSLVMSRVLARYLRECGIPTCRNTAGWAKALSDLLDALGDASLLALFAAMITEPEQTAHTVDDLLGGLARPFIGEVRQLIGV